MQKPNYSGSKFANIPNFLACETVHDRSKLAYRAQKDAYRIIISRSPGRRLRKFFAEGLAHHSGVSSCWSRSAQTVSAQLFCDGSAEASSCAHDRRDRRPHHGARVGDWRRFPVARRREGCWPGRRGRPPKAAFRRGGRRLWYPRRGRCASVTEWQEGPLPHVFPAARGCGRGGGVADAISTCAPAIPACVCAISPGASASDRCLVPST
jgi:hypothetical protein